MADIFRTVRGQSLVDYIEGLPGARGAVRRIAFELEAEAKKNLEAVRADLDYVTETPDGTHAVVEAYRVGAGRKSWVVALVDPAAKNIEMGRRAYIVRSRRWKTSRGRVRFRGDEYGGMVGLRIIQRAVNTVKNRRRKELRGG